MKLIAICEEAARANSGSVGSGNDLFHNLAVIRGRSHWDKEEDGWLHVEGGQSQRLSPDMEFCDDYMRFEYIAHYPIGLLFFHDTEKDLIDALLGEAGIFNPFTTCCVAFRSGQRSPFVCYYKDATGTERIFNKAEQIGFDGKFPDRRLLWLS